MHPQSPASWTPRAGVGVTDSLRSLLASALLYGEARLRLARLEGREALRLGLRAAALLLVIVTSVFIAYVSGMFAFTLWIAHHWWHGSVMPAALIVALAHLEIAILCAAGLVRASRGRHLFHATLREFMEDRQWLHANQKSPD